LHQSDRVFHREANPIADDLSYFVDAMSYCLKVGQMKAFHLKNVPMLSLHWMVWTKDVSP